jgi:hypothetical protein
LRQDAGGGGGLHTLRAVHDRHQTPCQRHRRR